jgi:protein-ribulosamine 3-kinase
MSTLHPLREAHIRSAIEAAVSAHTGRTWRTDNFQDLNDLASHPCALFAGEGLTVFVKLSTAANAADQFESELAGLRLLTERSGVATPAAVGMAPLEAGALLITEAVQVIERGDEQWRDIGRALARMHGVTSTVCGLDTHCYFGPIYQDNRPLPDWPTFYAERRLWPRLISAIDAGHMPAAAARRVKRVIERLPELCGPPVSPALLHGDAQANNFISTAAGAVAVDAAVHYGHPELDLAYAGYWQAVPEQLFEGYRELRPIDSGFGERCDLWRISGYLAAVAVAGPEYLPRLMDCVAQYQ